MYYILNKRIFIIVLQIEIDNADARCFSPKPIMC